MRKQILGEILNTLGAASVEPYNKTAKSYTDRIEFLVHDVLRHHASKGNIDRIKWMEDNKINVKVIDNTADIGVPGWLEKWLNQGDEV